MRLRSPSILPVASSLARAAISSAPPPAERSDPVGDEAVPVTGSNHGEWSFHAARGDGRSYLMRVNRIAGRRFTPAVQVKTAAGERQLRLASDPRSVAVVSF